MNITIEPVKGKHAEQLFPLITDEITKTIQWDGPTSKEDYINGLSEREQLHTDGKIHMFTIIDSKTSTPMGSIDIRPDENMFIADVGLWIGEKYSGKGVGTSAIQKISDYGFSTLGLNKIEAYIFSGNTASRRVFEKCGYLLEGTIRSKVIKRGVEIDEWVFGQLKIEWKNSGGSRWL